MQGLHTQAALSGADTQTIRFTPYAWRKTGLLRSQIFLRIEKYLLVCTPFQISTHGAVLLAVLSQREYLFFSQFQRRFCSVSLAFQQANARKPENLILRGTIDRIGLAKERQDVCIFEVALVSAPSGLKEILDRYTRTYSGLKSFYENFAGKAVQMEQAGVALGSIGNRVTLTTRGMKASTTLVSVAVDSLSLKLNDPLPGLKEGTECSLQLALNGSPFTVSGKVTSLAAGNDFEMERVTLSFGFTPEIVEFLDDYFFRMNLRAARAG